VRDLLDLKQAFAPGVHLLIHKPASAVQIERCLRAAYSATVARQRKHHRESVALLASVSSRTEPFGEATVVNLSEGGAKLRASVQDFVAGVSLSAGDDVGVRFALPGTEEMLHVDATVVWAPADTCGIRFRYIPESHKAAPAAMAHSVREAVDFAVVASGSGKPARREALPRRTQRNREKTKGPLQAGLFISCNFLTDGPWDCLELLKSTAARWAA
jgi:hypothetical protein